MTLLLCVMLFATVLLATATPLAAYARLPWRWTQFIVPTLTGWIPAAFWNLAIVLGDGMRFFVVELPRRFHDLPTATLMACSLVGGLMIGLILLPIVGLWRRRVDGMLVPIAARWPILKLLVATIACAVLLLATTVVADIRVRGQIAQRRAESRATIERLRSEPVADEDDAAPLLREAYGLIGNKDERPAWWDRAVEAGLDVNSPEVAEYLAAHGRSIELAISASRLPKARFTWMSAPSLVVDNSDDHEVVITSGRLLYLASLRRAATGDLPGGVACLDALRRLARQELSPRTTIGALAQMGLERSRLKAFENLLAAGTFKSSEFEVPIIADQHSYRPALRTAFELQGASDMEAMCQAMMGEISYGALDTEPEPQSGPAYQLGLMLTRVFITGDDLDQYPAFVARLRKTLQTSPIETPEAYEQFDAYGDDILRGMMTRMLGFAYCYVVQQAPRTDLTVRLADVGLALAAFQARHGKLPAKLDDLVPEFLDRVPLGPYDGQPLRISPDGAGFVVHAGEFANLDFDQNPALCLGESYTRRRVEPAREDAARFGP